MKKEHAPFCSGTHSSANCPIASLDYHQRFRERFDGEHLNDCRSDILAFIDEVVAEERARVAKEYHHAGDVLGYARGKRETRYALIEKIEGKRKTYEGKNPVVMENHYDTIRVDAYNRALDDLTTYLRGEDHVEISDLGNDLAEYAKGKKEGHDHKDWPFCDCRRHRDV